MTNTLHRYGNAESFQDDYVVFAMASKGNVADRRDTLLDIVRILRQAAA